MGICTSCFKDNSHVLLKHVNHNPAHWLGWKVALLRGKWYSFKVLTTLSGRWNEKKKKQAETIPLTLYRVSDLKFSMSGKERYKTIENFYVYCTT